MEDHIDLEDLKRYRETAESQVPKPEKVIVLSMILVPHIVYSRLAGSQAGLAG